MKRFLFCILTLYFLVVPVFSLTLNGGDIYDSRTDGVYSVTGDVWPLSPFAEAVPYALAPVTPASDGSLKAILLRLLGNYDPVVVEYRYVNNNGTYNYLREISPDFPWICSAAVFGLCLFCAFKILGGFLSKI